MKRVLGFFVALALGVALHPAPASAKTARISRCGAVISTPGSYVLSRNLVGAAGGAADCIAVEASHVTIDLGGYNIDCRDAGLDGIAVAAGLKDVTIRNGTIANCSEGIAADGASVWAEAVLTVDNNSHGIRVGANSTVLQCLSYGNVGYGIMAQCPSNVTQNVSVANYNPFYLNGAGCNNTYNASN